MQQNVLTIQTAVAFIVGVTIIGGAFLYKESGSETVSAGTAQDISANTAQGNPSATSREYEERQNTQVLSQNEGKKEARSDAPQIAEGSSSTPHALSPQERGSEKESVGVQVVKEIMQSEGNKMSTSTGEKLIKKAVEEKLVSAHDEVKVAKVYTVDDLTVATNTKKAKEAYIADIFRITDTYREEHLVEQENMMQKLKERDQETIATLKQNAKGYYRLAEALSEVSVPQKALMAHRDMINGYHNMGRALENASSIRSEPFRSVRGIIQVKGVRARLTEITDTLDTILGA